MLGVSKVSWTESSSDNLTGGKREIYSDKLTATLTGLLAQRWGCLMEKMMKSSREVC